MDRTTRIHELLNAAASEVLEFVRESESKFTDRWVPATYIKDQLDLNLAPYPKDKTQRGAKGWLFSTLARKLEDQGQLEYDMKGNRAYYRSKKQ